MITMDRFNSSEDIELNEFREWVDLVHDHLPPSFDFNDSKKLDKWLNELFDKGIQYEEAAKIIYNTSNESPRYSLEELKVLCNEMLFQLTGNSIEEHEQCETQGHPDWQIAMYYFRKINDV